MPTERRDSRKICRFPLASWLWLVRTVDGSALSPAAPPLSVAVAQSLTDLSADPEYTREPSGCTAIARTAAVWPVRTRSPVSLSSLVKERKQTA